MRAPLFVSQASSAAVVLVLAACAPGEDAAVSDATDPAPPPLRLYVFGCGELKAQAHQYELFSLTAEEAGTDRLSVYCYLIDHPRGRLLWDGGVPADIAGLEGWHEVHTALTHLERSLADQLADLDLGPADIDFVAFSHLHWDHVGQGAQFTESVHLIQRPEHEAAFVPEPTVPFFDPALYGALADNETLRLDGDHDVFGDGRVVIKSTPGHTPGHQSLYVELASTGPVVLSGDLYHFRANYELGRVPTFNVDAEQTRASMAALDTFLAESGAELWIEHDALRPMELSPAFYD
ncbi:MAG: N-acyl homoserine lactonase family protein [Thermoanaerobaculia bacterium]|nr:N-acyl homoserine lactonase family protein [Thermoanaerobaculia bacterium]